MSETPMVTFSSVDNPITWNIEGESKCLVFASPSEAKRAEELFTAMQRALAAERERADMAKAEGIKEGMRRAAGIVRQNAKEVALSVRPYEPISVENVRLLMEDANDACAAIALAILKEAGE